MCIRDSPEYGQAFQRFYIETRTGEMFNFDAFNGSQGAIELDAWFMLLDCPGFSIEGRIAFLDHLIAISDFAWDDAVSQWTQISLGPEGHNWWLHGIHVLPFIGLLFPEFKRAEFFLKASWSVIEEHVRAHYKADGGARETTPSYQYGSLLCLWDFYQLAVRNTYPVSPAFEEHLLNNTMFLLKLATPMGGVPSYGDSHHIAGELTTLAAVAAALSGDGYCKWYAEHFRGLRENVFLEKEGVIPESAFWKTGLEGMEKYAVIKTRNPHQKSVLLPNTGYIVMRASDKPNSSYLAMAAAERGPIVTSHGHNDIFSIEVHADGIRFIGEMGCAPYGNSAGRMYDESTEAHTCFKVKGEEQVPLAGEWRWTHQLRPAIVRWISQPTHDFIHAVHEGFYHFPDRQVLYGRKIFFRKPRSRKELGYWLIFDWVESNCKSEYQAFFHACVAGRIDGRHIILGDKDQTNLHIIPVSDYISAPMMVNSEGLTAYLQERKLDKQKYPCFCYEMTGESDCFVWALFPLRKKGNAPSVRLLPVVANGAGVDWHDASAIEIKYGDDVETVCVYHRTYDAELQYGAYKDWGIVAYHSIDVNFVHEAKDGIAGS